MFFRAKPDGRARLSDVMRLRRAYLPEPLSPVAAEQLEEATRRCLACNAKKLCEEALEAGDANGFALFCPNSHYIQQVRSSSLSFR